MLEVCEFSECSVELFSGIWPTRVLLRLSYRKELESPISPRTGPGQMPSTRTTLPFRNARGGVLTDSNPTHLQPLRHRDRVRDLAWREGLHDRLHY